MKDASGAVSFLGGGQWADNLPRLIQARLIHTFENASQLAGVSRPSSGAVADVQLTSEIRAFEIATPDNEAVVEISVKLVTDQDGRIVNGRIFAARVPVGAVDASERRPGARRGAVDGHARHRALGEGARPRREDPGSGDGSRPATGRLGLVIVMPGLVPGIDAAPQPRRHLVARERSPESIPSRARTMRSSDPAKERGAPLRARMPRAAKKRGSRPRFGSTPPPAQSNRPLAWASMV